MSQSSYGGLGAALSSFRGIHMQGYDCFEDVLAWRMARRLSNEVHEAAARRRWGEDLPLRQRLCRHSLSVMAAIADGFEHRDDSAMLRCLDAARGSAASVRSDLYAALDQGHLDAETFDRLQRLAVATGSLVQTMVRYVEDRLQSPDRASVRGPHLVWEPQEV